MHPTAWTAPASFLRIVDGWLAGQARFLADGHESVANTNSLIRWL